MRGIMLRLHQSCNSWTDTWMCNLKSLEHLDLSNNALEHFPEQLTSCVVSPSPSCSFQNVFFLVSRSTLMRLATWFLQELRVLRISENNIRVITAGLTTIISLREFHAGNNQIFTVLGDWSNLANLRVSSPLPRSWFSRGAADKCLWCFLLLRFLI
jgi:Leucine-rich repeat (LRR) protein